MKSDFVYLLWRDGGNVTFAGVVATEDEAETWRLAPGRGESRWWEMWEVGQPAQGRLDSSPVARG